MPSNAEMLASSEEISPYVTTGAASDVTFRAHEDRQRDEDRWVATVDTLLAWRRESVAGSADAPRAASIESAIDLAIDSQNQSLPVPTSVALTGDGGVAFEWVTPDEIVTIEIVASGLAELTRFRKGRVVEEVILQRNPKTRRLELRGAAVE